MTNEDLKDVDFLVHYVGDTETSHRKIRTVRKIVRNLGLDWEKALKQMFQPRGLRLDPFKTGLYGIIALGEYPVKKA